MHNSSNNSNSGSQSNYNRYSDQQSEWPFGSSGDSGSSGSGPSDSSQSSGSGCSGSICVSGDLATSVVNPAVGKPTQVNAAQDEGMPPIFSEEYVLKQSPAWQAEYRAKWLAYQARRVANNSDVANVGVAPPVGEGHALTNLDGCFQGSHCAGNGTGGPRTEDYAAKDEAPKGAPGAAQPPQQADAGGENSVGPGWRKSPEGAPTGGHAWSGLSNAGAGGRPADGSFAIPPVKRTDRAQQAQTFQETLSAAQNLFKMGDYRQAVQEAERAMRMQPKNLEALELYRQAALKMRNFNAAAAAAREALRLKPTAEGYQNLAWAELNAGKFKEAEADASRSIELGGGAQALLTRAFALEALGDRAGMLRDLEAAARLDPGYRSYLERARKGETIFDPKAADNSGLLDGAGRGGRRPAAGLWLWDAIAYALMAALAAGLWALWRRFSPAARRASRERVLSEALLGPAGKGAPQAAAPGQDGLLGGKYQLLRIVGRGASGQVWEARDRSLERTVAVRRVFLPEKDAAAARERCLERARAIASLRHPHVADIYEILDHPTGIYLVFEFLGGETLRQALARRRALPFREALALLRQVSSALAYAHAQGVAHEDLKPANVALLEGGRAKVMDFALLPPSPDAGLAVPRPYLPPEGPAAGPAGDVYQLGLLLYEALVGERPFGAQGARSAAGRVFVPAGRRVRVPEGVDALIAQALDEKAAARPAGAKEFLARLEALPEPTPVS